MSRAQRGPVLLADVVSNIYAHTRPEDGCLVTTRSRDQHGYAYGAWKGKVTRAHRLVAQYSLGPCPEGMVVRHLCGRGHKGCVTASHLRYGTRQQDADDRMRHGRQARGEKQGSARLTEDMVRWLRTQQTGLSYRALGRQLGIGGDAVRRAILGITWGHVR